MSNHDIASQTIMSIAKLRGLDVVNLPPSGAVGYGSLQFGHRGTDAYFHVAVLIAQNPVWNVIDDEAIQAQLRFVQSLTDPAIGQKFDTAGASWNFEHSTGRLLPYRNFPVDAPPAQVSAFIDHLLDIAAMWIDHWISAVSNIVFHGARPPMRIVTLQDNPYSDKS